MPRGDRTGPRGMGPMTGRAAGFCAGYEMPGYTNHLPGRGFGMGFGRGRGAWGRGFAGGGRGWRNMFNASGQPGWMPYGGYAAPVANADPEMEKQSLKNQADYLQGELDAIRKRLEEVEKEAAQK
ncbi:MAG: DUF5320 domain-containing protein [Candidatus Aminicenantes bacterium]|nr:DUF5320 domain-containing protein [Candidatus Aminicenantes bacterium]